MSRDTTYFELLESLPQEGCALCRLSQRTVERYLAAVLFESVNDVTVQESLKATQGFCPAHSETLLRQGDSLGTAILYRAIVGHLAKQLPQTADEGSGWLGRLSRRGERDKGTMPPPTAPCPACDQRDKAAARYLEPLQAVHTDEALGDALHTSPGFCLPHLRQAMASLKGEALAQVLRHHEERWEHLRAELAEIVRKNDYRYRDEGFGPERDAWLRAVRIVAGEPDVF